MMANKEWCRHYTGTGNTDECKAGVAYESVKDTTYHYPCTGKCTTTCAKFEHWTEAEIAETEQYVADFVKKSNDFASGESRVCPQCGTPVTGATLYAKWKPDMYSLYVQPCNCRLGLWGKAPDWIENVTIIPVQDDWMDDSDEMENDDEASEPTFDPGAQEAAGQQRLPGLEAE